MTGIAELFESLSGYSEYEMQLELWAHWKRARQAECTRDWQRAHPGHNYQYVKAWRKRNPEKFRAAQKRAVASRKARIPERVAELRREAQKRQRARRPEHYRELARRNQQAHRDRLVAAGLCIDCRAPRGLHLRCDACAEKNRIKLRDYHAARKARRAQQT